MSATTKLSELLKQRHLLAVASHAGWRSSKLSDGTPGWKYPVFAEDGEPYDVQRWKAADSEHEPKYLWMPKDAERPAYYMLPGTLDAIREMGNVLHIAAGEPDVLTLHAADWPNSLCWFGENDVPDTLAEDLKRWGVRRAIYYPDLDRAGIDAALRVMDALEGSGIELDVRIIPGQPVSEKRGYDLNRLWQDCAGDLATFRAALLSGTSATRDTLRDMRGARAQPPAPRETPTSGDEHAPDQEAEVRRRTLDEIARRLKKRGAHEHVYECPFPDHGEDGKDFYFNAETGQIGGCQGKHAGQLTRWRDLAEFLGIDVTQIARDVRREAASNGKPAGKTETAEKEKPPVPIVSSQEALDHLVKLTNGEEVIAVEPFPAPYKPLRLFGGLVALWEPRTVIVVIGPSGMGKTAFLETAQDGLRQAGYDFIMWGPEWTPLMYQMRAVAAYGGPSVDEQRRDFIWQKEAANNVPLDKRNGTALTGDQRALVNRIANRIARWPGHGYYIDKAGLSIDQMLAAAEERIWELRVGAGRRVVAFFLDYIQKARRGAGENWAEMEHVVQRVSQFAVDNNVVGVVASQVNKYTAARVRKGELLDEASGQSLSDQQGNVVITLNPVWENGERHEKAWIRVVKHSFGVAPAKLLVATALNRHRWRNKILSELQADTFANGTHEDEDDYADDEGNEPRELHLPWLDRRDISS